MTNRKFPVHFDYEKRLVFFINYYCDFRQSSVDDKLLATMYVHSPEEEQHWIDTFTKMYHRKHRNYFGCDYTLYLTYKVFDCSFHYGK